MKKIFSSPDPIMVRSLEAFLNSKGVDTLIQGEDRLTTAGGIAPIECWVDLMVLDDERELEARSHADGYFSAVSHSQTTWKCQSCGELLPEHFTDCWRCASEAMPTTISIDPELMRKKSQFRVLVILDFVIAMALLKISGIANHHLPVTFQDAMKASQVNIIWDYPGALETWYALSLVAWVGLLFFKNFGRLLYTGLWLFYLVTFFFYPTGISVSYPPLSLVSILSSCMVGAILALAYISSLATLFGSSTGSSNKVSLGE